jgi:ubiquinone/menaquinone biosynthesis C-methylase UbiE
VIYQHPVAYLVAVEGVALLRAFAGEYDREFTHARLGEVRRFMEDLEGWGDGAKVPPITVEEGYEQWAESYDDEPNQLIELEQPIVQEILDGLPIGVALDVACGTGRHTRHLSGLGHMVIGIDRSSAMLAAASAKVPAASFRRADLHELPLPDRCIDVLVCALALTHAPDLSTAFAEFVRVLKPGGHLVLSDSRGLFGYFAPPVVTAHGDSGPGHLPHSNRHTSDYLAAALPFGLRVRRCDEPRRPSPLMDPGTEVPSEPDPTVPPNIWQLHRWCAEATNAAFRDNPAAIIWHFELQQS